MRHYPGYSEAREKLYTADLKTLLAAIDTLYGRDNLKYGATLEDVRQEALRQQEIDWRMSDKEIQALEMETLLKRARGK